jgi:hypothetical protein
MTRFIVEPVDHKSTLTVLAATAGTHAVNKTQAEAIASTAAGVLDAAEILTRIKTVDGAGSGLDADLLDGLSSGAFATAIHNHVAADITDFTAAVNALISNVVNGAPGALDTLNELATALGNDAAFATTVNTALGIRAKYYTTTIGDGATTTFTITHNLGRAGVHAVVYSSTDSLDIKPSNRTTNGFDLVFSGYVPATGAVSVEVIG